MIPHPRGSDWFWLGLAAIMCGHILYWIWQRKSSGAVLLDLGHAGTKFNLVVGALVLAACLYQIAFTRHRFADLFAFAGFAWSLILDGVSRSQVRERGVFGRDQNLIRWDRILGYELSPFSKLSLNLRGKGWTFCCDVRPERREELADLMAQRFPATDVS